MGRKQPSVHLNDTPSRYPKDRKDELRETVGSPGSHPSRKAGRRSVGTPGNPGYSRKRDTHGVGRGNAGSNPAPTLRDLAERFDRDNRLAGLSDATRERTYNLILRRFLRGRSIPEVDCSSLRESMEEFLLDCQKQELSPVSIKDYYRGLSRWFSWMVSSGYLPSHPLQGMRSPRVPKSDKQLPDKGGIRRILADPGGRNSLRDKAILMLALDGNLRLGEIHTLEVENLDAEHGIIRVQGKGRKWRRVPLGREAWRSLYAYLDHRMNPHGRSRVFLSEHGEELTYWGFKQIWRRIRERSGVDFTFHSLRHLGATDDALHGMNPFVLQEKLGHSNIQTTMKYVHLAEQLKQGGYQDGTGDRIWRNR